MMRRDYVFILYSLLMVGAKKGSCCSANRTIRCVFRQRCRVPLVLGKLKAAAKLSCFGHPNANKVILTDIKNMISLFL